MPEPRVTRVVLSPDLLTLEWAHGGTSGFTSLWLRDNRPQDRDSHSGQRLIDITDLPERPLLRAAVAEQGVLRIEWEGEQRDAAAFELGWLAAHAFEHTARAPELEVHRWLEGSTRAPRRDFAFVDLREARANSAVRLRWLTGLLRDGLAFITGLPATESAILDAVRLIGRVLETNYGFTFDVRSVAQPENLAYSDLGLGLHTDNPYREPVPGFQALHALIPSRAGGESLFADGFALAEHLRATDPQAFERLAGTPVAFLYRSPDAELYAERPLIRLSPAGEVAAVHYNSRSIAPLRLSAPETMLFYAAYRRFAELLREERFQLRMRLEDGMLAVFDNQRILHGRRAFASAKHARHLRGCYLSRDSVYSEAALLRRRLGTGSSQ